MRRRLSVEEAEELEEQWQAFGEFRRAARGPSPSAGCIVGPSDGDSTDRRAALDAPHISPDYPDD